MTVTVCRATLLDKFNRKHHASVSWEKTSPRKLRARITAGFSHPNPGAELWSAGRYRRDGEGQRQLEKSLAASALKMNLTPKEFIRTKFSARGIDLPSPFELARPSRGSIIKNPSHPMRLL